MKRIFREGIRGQCRADSARLDVRRKKSTEPTATELFRKKYHKKTEKDEHNDHRHIFDRSKNHEKEKQNIKRKC